MQLCFIAPNQQQHKFDFPTALYETLTLILPSKQITIDFQTSQVYNRAIENPVHIYTAELVSKFQTHQERRGLSRSTIASYRSVLIALANFAPDWPPPLKRSKRSWIPITPTPMSLS